MPSPTLLFLLRQKQGQSLWNDTSNRKPGLSNSIESLIAGLRTVGISADIDYLVDSNSIDRVVREQKPTVCILEAYWVPPAKLQHLMMLHPHIHWIVRNHSEVPFLAEEGNAAKWSCEYLKMGAELSNVSTRTVEDLKPILDNLEISADLLTFLPNIYLGHLDRIPDVKPYPINSLHVGCFGAVRTMKNHFEQALAAIAYAHETDRILYFHINGTRIEGNGSQPLRNLRNLFQRMNRCELVEHNWMDKPAFYHLLETQIDVVMQCSLTESFNIVAADAVLASVPVITSPEVRWLDSDDHCDPVSVPSILQQFRDVFGSQVRPSHEQRVADQRHSLSRYNTHALNVWKQRFS